MKDKCVLVVDDDDDLREGVAEALRFAGYAVREAVTGRDALAQLQAMPGVPCLVLLDLMMPEMTGAELMAVLGETQRLAALPVVIVSGEAVHVRRARRFIRKPVSAAALLQIVQEYCGEP